MVVHPHLATSTVFVFEGYTPRETGSSSHLCLPNSAYFQSSLLTGLGYSSLTVDMCILKTANKGVPGIAVF